MTEPEPFTSPRRFEAADDGGGAASDPEADPSSAWYVPTSEEVRADDGVATTIAGSSPADATPADATPADVATTTDAVADPVTDGDDDSEGARQRSTAASMLRELPVLILIAFVLAFLLRTFVVQVFYIPSSSMEPTLQVDDRILVDKVTYNFRDLARGEIVVFEGDQAAPVTDEGTVESVLRGLGQLVGVTPVSARDFVKRVVGLPGDEVYIDEDGTVFVNGEALDEPYLGQRDPRTCGPLTVPEGKLFFLGDNRANSSDSRAGLGYVSVEHVVGRAFLTLWPPDRLHLLDRPAYLGVPEPADAPPPAAVPDVSDVCNS